MTQRESDLQELKAADLPLKAKRRLFLTLKRKPGTPLGPLLASAVQAFQAAGGVHEPPRRVVSRDERSAESEAEWDAIFAEKFLDPDYYTQPARCTNPQSALGIDRK